MRRGIRRKRSMVRVAMLFAIAVVLVGIGAILESRTFSALDVIWSLPRH